MELSVIRNLEGDGLVLGSTMLYEATRVPYGRGGRRTYVVDLTLPQTRTLIEVKPEARLATRSNAVKRAAAERWCDAAGWTYAVITERWLRERGGVLTLEEAAGIPEVRLDPRASRTLARRLRRKRGPDRSG